jgi:hypothetical protein
MKFNSVKEMEAGLLKVTSLKTLKEEIIFASQGNTIVLKPIGLGTSAGETEAAFLSNETSDKLKIVFSGSGDTISVTRVKLTRA